MVGDEYDLCVSLKVEVGSAGQIVGQQTHTDRLEQFSNSCALLSCVQGGSFLRKKPLIIVLSVYSNWRTPIIFRLRSGAFRVHQCGRHPAFTPGGYSAPMSYSSGLAFAKRLVSAGVLMLAAAWGKAQETAAAPISLSVHEVVAQVQLRAQAQTLELRRYRAVRHYQVDYRSLSARMDAEVSYDAVEGKSFRIVSQSGSRLLCDKVLKRALESEIEASRDRGLTALSEANYRFQLTGSETVAGRPAYVLDAQPVTASKFLFRGKVWIDAADFAVVKMETEPARNPSFWISRTLIHYSGAKVNGFWLPREVRTETKVRIGGTAVLSIDYGTYQVVPATLEAANF